MAFYNGYRALSASRIVSYRFRIFGIIQVVGLANGVQMEVSHIEKGQCFSLSPTILDPDGVTAIR